MVTASANANKSHTPNPYPIDSAAVVKFLPTVTEPGSTLELRFIGPEDAKGKKRAESRCFPVDADMGDAVAASLATAPSWASGAYWCMNPLRAGHRGAASDSHVLRRRWLLIDVDPLRPAEFVKDMATDAERLAAVAIAGSIRERLAARNWPAPIVVESGNGVQLLYRVDLPNDEEGRAAIAAFLERLSREFAGLDKSVSNAARLARLPGTWNRRGGRDIAGRPFRMAQVAAMPESFGLVTLAQILAASTDEESESPTPPPRRPAQAGTKAGAKAGGGDSGRPTVEARAADYLGKIDGAVSGAGGSNPTLWAARAVVYGFDLGVERGLRLLMEHYNPRCRPPWTEKELRHKCEDADAKPYTKPRGWLLTEDSRGGATAFRPSGQAQAGEPGGAGDAREEGPPNASPPPRDEPGDEERKPNAATRLVRAVEKAGVKLFHSEDGEAYGFIPAGASGITYPLKSSAFKLWMAHLIYRAEGATVSAQVVADALSALTGQAMFAGPCEPVWVRLGEACGKLYLDLADPTGNAIEIDGEGWRVVAPPVRFPRRSSMLPMPEPMPGGSLRQLREMVNVRDEDWPLLLGWLFGCFLPRGPFPILTLGGEQGVSKSTSAKTLRRLIDPARGGLRSQPKDEQTLAINARNSWLVAYDNFSSMPTWLSDALARLATGGGLSMRKLYSDDEEIIFDQKRPALVTAIPDVVTAADLLDRTVRVTLEPIPVESRKTEAELWGAFDLAEPAILGALMDAISNGIRIRPALSLEKKPRMADFALWAEACCRGAGLRPGAFLEAYEGNRRDASAQALDGSHVAGVLIEWLKAPTVEVDKSDPGLWEVRMSSTGLLAALTAQAGERARQKGWPSKAQSLTNQLKRDTPALRTIGISVERGRGDGKKRDRFIRITWNPASDAPQAEADAPDARDEGEASARKSNRNNDMGSNPGTSDASDASSPSTQGSGYGDPDIDCPF